MPDFDVLIHGAKPFREIGIAGGKIVSFSAGSAREEIDASGLLVLPGVVDAHVHFNEPGRTEWEGWETGSRGAVAGGVTTVCDMPLNSTPPLVDAVAFDAKHAAAKAKSVCDFAFWGGIVPGKLDELERLAERGVIGFKAFMCNSGISDFARADNSTLRDGMKRAVKTGLPVAVHAESEALTQKLSAEKIFGGKLSVRDYLESRPIEAELEAIGAAIDMAGDTRCALHAVHVSSAEGVALIADAKRRGADVTCETCPHYLVLTGRDMEQLGAVAKCAPPMRDEKNLDALWEHVRAGRVDTIGSDHSPSPWALKENTDFFKVWGGISGVQHLLPLLLDAGLEPELFAKLAGNNPAQRFRLPGKGKLEVGADADLVLVETGEPREVTTESLFYRHRHSPYVGRRLRARVRRTILRGKTIFNDGKMAATSGGGLLKPL